MTTSDLADTHARAFPGGGWSQKDFDHWLSRSGTVFVGNAKSFILAYLAADELEVLTLATHPDSQRHGFALANLRSLIEEATLRGAGRLFLEVAEDNLAAIALYAKAGLLEIARRPKYYRRTDGDHIDAIVMARDL